MSDAGNEITGVIVTILAYFAWQIGQMPGASDYLVQVFSKGELYIFALVLCFILLWSFVHALVFVLNLLTGLAIWAHKVFITDNAETREHIRIASEKIHEIIKIIRTDHTNNNLAGQEK